MQYIFHLSLSDLTKVIFLEWTPAALTFPVAALDAISESPWQRLWCKGHDKCHPLFRKTGHTSFSPRQNESLMAHLDPLA